MNYLMGDETLKSQISIWVETKMFLSKFGF